MKKILLIAIAFLPLAVSAQKLLKPEIDRISGDTTWSTSKDKVYVHGNVLTQQGEGVESLAARTGKTVVLILIPQTLNEKSVFTVTEGQKAYLKLQNNSTVTLTCQMAFLLSDYKTDVAGNSVNSSGILRVPYVLSDDDIAKLKASPLAFLRIETSIGNFDCEIKSKFSEVIKKQVELITAAKK